MGQSGIEDRLSSALTGLPFPFLLYTNNQKRLPPNDIATLHEEQRTRLTHSKAAINSSNSFPVPPPSNKVSDTVFLSKVA